MRALARGALAVFPTEGLYGLGADARSEAAVERLVAVRGREAGKLHEALSLTVISGNQYPTATR